MAQKGSALIVFLVIAAVVSTGAAAYFFGRNQSLIKGLDLMEENSIESPEVTQIPYESFNAPSTQAGSAKPAPAVVVFEAEGSFTKAEKDELTKKVANPFVDYYKMEVKDQVLLTLTISKNDKASKETYPYQAEGIFQGGATTGFLIMKEAVGVSWWFPECMNGCNLSASYKSKYPEIAAKTGE